MHVGIYMRIYIYIYIYIYCYTYHKNLSQFLQRFLHKDRAKPLFQIQSPLQELAGPRPLRSLPGSLGWGLGFGSRFRV